MSYNIVQADGSLKNIAGGGLQIDTLNYIGSGSYALSIEFPKDIKAFSIASDTPIGTNQYTYAETQLTSVNAHLIFGYSATFNHSQMYTFLGTITYNNRTLNIERLQPWLNVPDTSYTITYLY